MRRACFSTAVASAAAIFTTAPAALANGRFPESNQVLFVEDVPDVVLLRATFGLLVSRDRGMTWEWICEQSVGYSGVEDPMYTVAPSNAVLAATLEGISISRDNGCRWSRVGGDLAGQVFIDLAANPRDKKDIVFFASGYDQQDDAGRAFFTSKVWETKDEGQTFQLLGTSLDRTLLGFTIDFTATDPDRLYASVVRNPGPQPTAMLLTSKNHGQTWDEELVPLLDEERSLYIAAVDPTNAERVYLRTYASSTDKPTRLILREAAPDGGFPTLRTVYQGLGALSAFALTPDGSKLYVGGPKDGVRVASTSDFAFDQRSTLAVNCLGLGPDGLWACSTEAAGFSAGLSKDDGVTFESRLHWCDIKGPLACGQNTPTADRCGAVWPNQQVLLGCGADARAPVDGGVVDAGPEAASDSVPQKPGCDCRAAPTGPWGPVTISAGGILALVWRERRNRRRPRR